MKEKNICPEKDTRCAAPSVTVAYCAEPCTVGLWRGRLVRETPSSVITWALRPRMLITAQGCSHRARPSHSVPEVR